MDNLINAFQKRLAEIGESALLSCLEPTPIQFTDQHEDDVPRVKAAIRRAAGGKIARFGVPVNRNGFLCGCLAYTETRAEEHLLVGYGVRHGSTTKVENLHHVTGDRSSVAIPIAVAHAMWDHYGRDEANEVILFHNHPMNWLTALMDNTPLASQADRRTLEARALNPQQVLRGILGQGRALFYLGENGFVKQFRLPSIL